MATRLRLAREARGVAQWALAERLGISSCFLSQLELGRRTPTAALAKKIADSLDLPVHDLFPNLSFGGGAEHGASKAAPADAG